MADGLAGGWGSAVILGLVEGVTEFLPVSSTGHLIVAGDLLGETSDAAKVFEIFIQLGAVLAVCWHDRRRVVGMAASVFSPGSPSFRLSVNIFIAFLPAAILGLLTHGLIKEHLFSPITVAWALIAGGVAIIFAERRRRPARISSLEELTAKDALVIGLAQTLALFPGVSRAGATIIGAVLHGVERKTATEFSFLLALPTMFAAAFYDLAQNRELLSPAFAGHLAIGFAAAFFSALVVIRGLLRFVAKHDFTVFGWYRIVFGGAILAAPTAIRMATGGG